MNRRIAVAALAGTAALAGDFRFGPDPQGLGSAGSDGARLGRFGGRRPGIRGEIRPVRPRVEGDGGEGFRAPPRAAGLEGPPQGPLREAERRSRVLRVGRREMVLRAATRSRIRRAIPSARPADLAWVEEKFASLLPHERQSGRSSPSATPAALQRRRDGGGDRLRPRPDAGLRLGRRKDVPPGTVLGLPPRPARGSPAPDRSLARARDRPARTRRSTSSSTRTWSAATARCAGFRWTGCSRRTRGSSTSAATTSSFRSGSATSGP